LTHLGGDLLDLLNHLSFELLKVDVVHGGQGDEGLGLGVLAELLDELPLVLPAADQSGLTVALGELIGKVVRGFGRRNFGDVAGAGLDLLQFEDLLSSGHDSLGVESHDVVLELSLADHAVELHGVCGLSTAVVPCLGLLGVDGLTVSNQTVLVSLTGEVDGPVLALGHVLGPHHLVVLLALAQLRPQHSALVLSHHVLGQLGHVVSVLTLALDPLLHGGPVELLLAVLLLGHVPEPRVPPVLTLGALLGLLDLHGGHQSLLEVDGPLGLLRVDLDGRELTLLHSELHRGLHVLLVLGGEGSAGLHLDVPPVGGLMR